MIDERDSVNHSLKELQEIEKKRSQEAKRRASEEALIKVRAEEEAKKAAQKAEQERRMAEAERLRKEEEERLRKEREDRIKNEEAAQRAQIEAEMATAKDRIAQEIEAKVAAKKLPWGTVIAGITILVLAVGGIGYYSHIKSKEAQKKQQQVEQQKALITKLMKDADDAKTKFKAEQEKLQNEKRSLAERLKTAKTDAEREMIERLEKARAERERLMIEDKARKQKQLEERRKLLQGTTKGGTDPIGGVDL